MTDDILNNVAAPVGATDPNAAEVAPPALAAVATPEWVCTATSPLAATLALEEFETRTGRPVSLWPVAQRSDGAQRAGRYAPDVPKHPARLVPATAARIIAQYSQPGQRILSLFCGSGTSVVEAMYGCREALGVDIDQHWANAACDNIAYAEQHGAYGPGHITCADARRLPEIPRRMRRSVDLVIATPPIRLNPRRTRPYETYDLIWDLEHDLRDALHSCAPLLRFGSTVAFVTRLTPYHGQLVDPTYPVSVAAIADGLEPIERAAALRIPIRDSETRPRAVRKGPVRRRRTAPPVVHEDVLVYHVPTRWQRWRYR